MPYRTRFNLPLALCLLVLLALAPATIGEIQTATIPYTHGDVQLEGYLAYDDALEGPRPGVLVVHEWWGLNDYAKQRARDLAAMGYVAFALDMYGGGRSTDDPAQASAWAGALYQDRPLLRQRAAAGLATLREQPQVDPQRLAAIGYCFGGTTVIELAWSGADLDGVVSFHGNPKPAMDASDREAIQSSVLILHGAADPLVSDESLDAVTESLAEAGADWMLIEYGDAVHSFTNPESSERGMDGVAYDAAADRRSWEHMRLFLEEVLAPDAGE